MTRLVEMRRDRYHQLWDHYADGTVWPHGVYRPMPAQDGWREIERADWQRAVQRERLVWARGELTQPGTREP